MAASVNQFPTALNNFTGQETLGVAHSAVHNALEAKLGIGASTPVASYALVGTGVGSSAWSLFIPAGNLVTDTNVITLTNKTLGEPLYSGFAGAALGDIFYVESDLHIERLPIGNLNDVLTTDATGRPTWQPGAGAGFVLGINGLTGNLTIAGTANQVNVVSGGTTITLSTPQDIATSSTPQFVTANLTGLNASSVVFTDPAKNLTTTGTIGVAQGGTGISTATLGDILYCSAPNVWSKLPIGLVGQILTVSGANIPAWTAGGGGGGVGSINGATGAITLNGTAPNQITIAQAPAGTFTFSLPQDIGTGSTPTFAGARFSGLSANKPVFTDGASPRNLTSAGIVPADQGGTGQSSYTIGDILVATGATTLSKLAAGAATQVLTSNGVGVAPSWQAGGGGSGGFTSGVRAVKSGNQALPIATNTVITGWTESYDGLGEFDPITGIFTASAAGTYAVNFFAQFNIAANSTGAIAAYITHNSNATTNNETQLQAQHTLPGITVTNIFGLSPGDTLRFMGNVIGGTLAAVTLLATVASPPYNFNTYISIQRIA